MSRIAVTLLAAACIAAVQVPATGGRALAAQSPALSVRQPVKPKPSPAPTHKPAPPGKRQGPRRRYRRRRCLGHPQTARRSPVSGM